MTGSSFTGLVISLNSRAGFKVADGKKKKKKNITRCPGVTWMRQTATWLLPSDSRVREVVVESALGKKKEPHPSCRVFKCSTFALRALEKKKKTRQNKQAMKGVSGLKENNLIYLQRDEKCVKKKKKKKY